MRPLLLVWLVLAGVAVASAQSLSEVDTLKAENLKLKAQVLELQRALAQAQLDAGTAALNTERTLLETQFRAVLKPQDGEVFDWQTLRFVPKPETPATPPVPPKH
jgi:hypothetical protein